MMNVLRPATAGRTRWLAGAACVAVWLVGTSTVRGQVVDTGTSAAGPRPYRGIFGGATERSAGPQSLVASAAIFGGYDDDIFARNNRTGSSDSGLTRPRVAGRYVGSQASLGYTHRFRSSLLTASAGTALRYLTSSEEVVPTFAAGTVAYTTRFNTRTTFNVQQTVAYRPYFSPIVLPSSPAAGPSLGAGVDGGGFDDPDTGGPDDMTLATSRDGLRSSTSAELTRRLSPRGSLQLRGRYGQAHFGDDDMAGLSSRRALAGAMYNYDLSRNLAARVGYAYRTFMTADGGTRVAHDLDLGVRFNKGFAFQRGHTTLSFTPGTTMVMRERLTADGESAGRRLRIRAVGNALLAHNFMSDWQARLEYTRFVGFLDGFADAVEGDRATASVGGFLTRAIDVSLNAGYVSGAIGMRRRNFNTALGGARIRVGLNAHTALFAQYFYYHFTFRDDVAATLLPLSDLDRQGVRVGLNVWLPLIH